MAKAIVDVYTDEELVDLIRHKLELLNYILTWVHLCSKTEFENFSVMFAFGYVWNKHGDDLRNMDSATLRMIWRNINLFPKQSNN